MSAVAAASAITPQIGAVAAIVGALASFIIGALTFLGRRLEERRQRDGPDAVGAFAALSAAQDVERTYLLKELTDVRTLLEEARMLLGFAQRRNEQFEADHEERVRRLERRVAALERWREQIEARLGVIDPDGNGGPA